MRLLLPLAAIAALLPQQAPPFNDMPLVPPTLRTRWAEDMRTKNLNDVLSLYTPAAVFVSPDGTTASSANDLRKLYETVFATYDSDITLAQPRHRTLGEPHAPTGLVDEGTYSEHLRTRATGSTQTLCGRYTFTYAHAPDGASGWRISRMEWTTAPCPAHNMPAP